MLKSQYQNIAKNLKKTVKFIYTHGFLPETQYFRKVSN